MRNSKDVFHLAIPCKDVGETVEFYETIMGCKLSRQYDDRATFNFFGDHFKILAALCFKSESYQMVFGS